MNTSAAPCEFLPWDSDFFGFRIARVQGNRLTLSLADEIDAWCAAESIACLYLLADPNDSLTVRTAEDHGYRFVDLRLTFTRALKADQQFTLSPHIRAYRDDDLDPLIAIARTGYTDSRFYFDPAFPRDKCDLFYETWVRNSTNGSGFADFVLVAEHNGLSAGFISGKCRGTIGHIGLVGVAAAARGQALGQALVNAAGAEFTARGMTRVEVVTQGRNLTAQRLYQRSGFLTHDLGLWYHKSF
jgi:dTDP-4-amino-4,6-dideoxy-D-galactose acyltransferase